MSNRILEFTAVVTDPDSKTDGYTLRTFSRSEADAKAFVTHLGRALLVEVVLEAIDNYNLRCISRMDISASDLFCAPSPTSNTSFEYFLNNYGRVETIWYPFTDNPWLKVADCTTKAQ
ncbi:hypothetical protein NUACC21_48560 [Scytonema sp. NUACC21]